MPLFTRENAAAMARRANVVRWSRPESPPEPPQVTERIPENSATQIALTTLEEIKLVSGLLNDELQSHRPDVERLDLLSRTKEKLWKVYAHAGGIPIAAPLKQKYRRDTGSIELVPTIEILPEPDPPTVMAPYSVIDKASTSHDSSPVLSSSETVEPSSLEPDHRAGEDSDQDNEPLG